VDAFAGEGSLEERVVRPARPIPFSLSFRLLVMVALRSGFVVCFGGGLVCFGGGLVCFGGGLVYFGVELGLVVLLKLELLVLLKLRPVVLAGTVGRVLLDELSHEAPARPGRHAPDGDQRRPDGQATPRRKAVFLLGRYVS
jgi:hypothetical protein